jgi:glycosyltransferase involved in cell wall biosynthesis
VSSTDPIVPEPFVSIVTPFYDSAAFLRECVESVLAQTYSNWEYVLVDNHSTDDSGTIAREYAARDSRLRVVSPPAHLPQTKNYNFALREISPRAEYCKIVQADDWIFPECIERMVGVAVRHPTIGLVSSYHLSGTEVFAQGLPWGQEYHSGAEIARAQLLGGRFYLGSPTAVLYRADLVRARTPFYDEAALHADTEAAYTILKEWDFGFVHQVLAFLRVGNPGIRTSTWSYNPNLLDFFIVMSRFGSAFLTPQELGERSKMIRQRYFSFLGRSVWQGRESEFWDYHRYGLSTVDLSLTPLRLAWWALWTAATQPVSTARAVAASVAKRVIGPRPSNPPGGSP